MPSATNWWSSTTTTVIGASDFRSPVGCDSCGAAVKSDDGDARTTASLRDGPSNGEPLNPFVVVVAPSDRSDFSRRLGYPMTLVITLRA